MTSQYIQVIEEELENKYPEHDEQHTLKLENIKFKLFLPKTTLILSEYQNLRALFINHCDLRNLDNFPKLYTLEQLDLGYNQIQGTFNNLMPLKRLKYLNVEHNLIFESNKLAPLRKIAACHSNQHDKNQAKISVCIRNNPFIEEDTPYLIKFKNYGLKVIKQPKEYFDKNKQDQDKLNKLKSSAKKGNKMQSPQSKNHNKRKMNWFQQSSNEDSSVLQHESPIMQANNDRSNVANNTNNSNNPNNASNNLNQNDRRSSILDDEPMHVLRVSRRNIVDNFGDDSGRLLVRLGSNRGERAAQLRNNIIEDQFPGLSLMSEEVQEDQIHNLREMFVFQDDDDSDSDGDDDDRFHNDLNHQSSNPNNNQTAFQQRMRSIERRNAMLRERREIERQLRQQRILRQRARMERQEERQRRILSQRQMRFDLQRRREQRELLRTEEERDMLLREQQRLLLRRLSSGSQNPFRSLGMDRSGDLNASISSSGDSRIIRMSHPEVSNTLGNRLGADSNPNQLNLVIDPIRRRLSSRQAFHRRLLQRSQSNVTGTDNNANVSDNLSRSNNLNTNNNLGISVLPSLRTRASEDIHPGIALIQRSSSIPGNVERIMFGGENDLNQRMHVINNGSMDSDSDQDEANNQESVSDSSDHDEEDDDDNEDDHICDSNCGCDPYRVEEEEDQQQNREQPQAENGRNDEEGDQIDSAMELFMGRVDNPNRFEGVDYESSDEQFDFVLNEHGLPVVRGQQDNTQPNIAPQRGNNQQFQLLLPDYESSDSD